MQFNACDNVNLHFKDDNSGQVECKVLKSLILNKNVREILGNISDIFISRVFIFINRYEFRINVKSYSRRCETDVLVAM